jgi:hypothetical protein
MVKCPWCNEWEGPPQEYSDHLKYCKKYPPHYEAIKERARVRSIERGSPMPSEEKIWKVKAKEFHWGRDHWEKVMIEPIRGKLLEYKRGEYVIFEAPRRLIEDYIRRRILYDYEILEEHSSNPFTKSPEEREKLKRQVDDMLTRMIEDEVKAQKEYEQIASILRDLNYPAEAEIIEKILKDEEKHWAQVNEVRNNVRVLSYAY